MFLCEEGWWVAEYFAHLTFSLLHEEERSWHVFREARLTTVSVHPRLAATPSLPRRDFVCSSCMCDFTDTKREIAVGFGLVRPSSPLLSISHGAVMRKSQIGFASRVFGRAATISPGLFRAARTLSSPPPLFPFSSVDAAKREVSSSVL